MNLAEVSSLNNMPKTPDLNIEAWKFFILGELFEIRKGKRLTKAQMTKGDTPFIGAVDSRNGVTARIGQKPSHDGGTITVSYNGSVAEAFYQPNPFLATDDVNVLYPKFEMTPEIALFICTVIRMEKYRFNYGRKWHLERMRSHEIRLPTKINGNPDFHFMERYIKYFPYVRMFDGANAPAIKSAPPNLDSTQWKTFTYQQLFTIERGKGPRIKDLNGQGNTPFITSIDGNNGLNNVTTMNPCHQGNVIGVNRNGSVAEAFYQPVPFCSTEDVHIFIPKFELNPYRAMFLCTLIKQEKYRFGYGRKWGIERMKKTEIRLPLNQDGNIDWLYMENYIKSLPFSLMIAV